MSAGSPSPGDKVIVVTNSLCRYEGFFRSVDRNTATFTLNKVRSFGTENRDAPQVYDASSRLYESVEFKAADVKEFILVGSPVLADPAVVSAREQKDEDSDSTRREFIASSPNLIREIESPSYAYQHGSTPLRQSPRNQRSFNSSSSGSVGHFEGGVYKQNASSNGSSYHGNSHGGSIGGYGYQTGGGGAGGGFSGGNRHHRNDWRSINPRSEGSFPQKHPGMQQQTMDDFNFEEGFLEFSRLKLNSPAEDENLAETEWADGPDSKEVKNKDQLQSNSPNQSYDKEKSFFDNLSGSADFEPARQQQNRFNRTGGGAGGGRSGDGQGGQRPRNPNVETFGEETVKQLYEIRKYVRDQRSSIRSGGYNGWHRSRGFHGHPSYFGARNDLGFRRQWFGASTFA